jgi:hypothetical protein
MIDEQTLEGRRDNLSQANQAVPHFSRDSNETDENNKQTVEVRHGPVPCVIKPLRRKALTK